MKKFFLTAAVLLAIVVLQAHAGDSKLHSKEVKTLLSASFDGKNFNGSYAIGGCKAHSAALSVSVSQGTPRENGIKVLIAKIHVTDTSVGEDTCESFHSARVIGPVDGLVFQAVEESGLSTGDSNTDIVVQLPEVSVRVDVPSTPKKVEKIEIYGDKEGCFPGLSTEESSPAPAPKQESFEDLPPLPKP